MNLQQRLKLRNDIWIIQSWKGSLHRFIQSIHHTNPLERRSEINLHLGITRLGRVLNLVSPRNILHHSTQHLLGHIHQIIVIRIGLVEFASCEFRIMGEVNSLITELTTNLIHAIQPSYDQHLEVKLRSDTKVQIHTQIIMISNKRPCDSSSRNHIHHGCLHFQKVTVVEVFPHTIDNLRTNLKRITILMVDNQIEVSLTVSRFRISQGCLGRISLVLGEHVETGGEKLHFHGKDGEFALLRLPGNSTNSNDISALDGAVNFFKCLFASGVGFEIGHDLKFGSISTNVVKE
mmetsp:Transcript_22206/g.33836  ORF Transcript_22206/g.33836 Transcript_22206/m.33836 type:complete len:291 (-) Transcript_22206:502-1374(-)